MPIFFLIVAIVAFIVAGVSIPAIGSDIAIIAVAIFVLVGVTALGFSAVIARIEKYGKSSADQR